MAKFTYLGRSPEGLLMGDAYTAVSDDEMVLFYNPAALSRHKGVSILPINANLQYPDVFDIQLSKMKFGLNKRFKNWPKKAEGVTDRIIGYPVHLDAGAAPTFKIGPFGLSLFSLNRAHLVLENAVYPVLDIEYGHDLGFIMGYAYKFMDKKKSENFGHTSSVGASFKMMSRKGLEGRYNLFGTKLLKIISDSKDYKAIRRELGYSRGDGFGFDLGWEHSYVMKNSSVTFGISWLDMGGIKFKKEEGKGTVPSQDQSINMGSAFHYKLGIFRTTVSLDYHNLLESKKFSPSLLHFGGRIRMPVLGLFAGRNGNYTSWGGELDLYILRLRAGVYSVNAGNSRYKRQARGGLVSLDLNLSFKDFPF